jgi:hypothetical protein
LEVFDLSRALPGYVIFPLKKNKRTVEKMRFSENHNTFRLKSIIHEPAKLTETLQKSPAIAGIFSLNNYAKGYNVMNPW